MKRVRKVGTALVRTELPSVGRWWEVLGLLQGLLCCGGWSRGGGCTSPEQPPAPVLMLLMMILRTGRREEAVLAILPGGTIMIAVIVRTLLGVLVEVEARGASDLE